MVQIYHKSTDDNKPATETSLRMKPCTCSCIYKKKAFTSSMHFEEHLAKSFQTHILSESGFLNSGNKLFYYFYSFIFYLFL